MKFKYSTCKDISSFEASVSEVVDLLIPESGVDVRINDRIDYLVEWAFGFSGSENELFNHLLDRFSGAIESVDLKSAYRLKALQFFHSSGDQSLLDELSALEDRVIPILKVGVGVITYNRIDHMIENITVKETRKYVKRVLETWGIYKWLYGSQSIALKPWQVGQTLTWNGGR